MMNSHSSSSSEYSADASPSRSCTSCPPTPVSQATDPDVGIPDVSALNSLPPATGSEYVLVTGGLGFIGSHTTVELLKSGYNVIIVDNLSNSYPHVLDRIREVGRLHYAEPAQAGSKCPIVEFHEMSYRDLPAMRVVLDAHAKCPPAPASFSKETTEDIITVPAIATTEETTSALPSSDIVGVIHFAAYKTLHESIKLPLKYYRNNINGFVDMLTMLEEYNIKTFIFSSSAVVYGALGEAGRQLQERNCVQQVERTEEDDVNGMPQSGCMDITSPYGRSKYFAEAILSDLALSDPSWNIVVLRYFNPVGCDSSGLLAEDPKGESLNLLPLVTQTITGLRKELIVFGNDWNTPDGTAMRDFIHVSDLARGHTAALSACREGRLRSSYRTFNLGVGKGCSILEVITTMEAVLGRSIPWRMASRRSGDVESSIAAVDRARQELGWQTEKSLWDACRDICNCLKLI